MKKELLNISGKLDRLSIETYAAIAEETNGLGIDYVVVGASARDLVLHYGHGLEITRATTDLDFAIEVEDWASFECLKDNLSKRGFTATNLPHRMKSPSGTIVDIVPFGSIADEEHTIRWPPEHEFAMSILGFPEACEHSDWIRIQEDPALDVPVVSPEGLLLLKLISWSDRGRDKRRKDALDIRYLLRAYDRLPVGETGVYEIDLLEQHDGDTQAISAFVLGRKAGEIANDPTFSYVKNVLEGNQREHLVLEMGSGEDEHDSNAGLVNLLLKGFVVSRAGVIE